MIEPVNEKVAVISSTNPKAQQVKVHRMLWRNQVYRFTKFGFKHTIREGRHIYHIFELADGTTDFRLRFDTETMQWTLEGISDGHAT